MASSNRSTSPVPETEPSENSSQPPIVEKKMTLDDVVLPKGFLEPLKPKNQGEAGPSRKRNYTVISRNPTMIRTARKKVRTNLPKFVNVRDNRSPSPSPPPPPRQPASPPSSPPSSSELEPAPFYPSARLLVRMKDLRDTRLEIMGEMDDRSLTQEYQMEMLKKDVKEELYASNGRARDRESRIEAALDGLCALRVEHHKLKKDYEEVCQRGLAFAATVSVLLASVILAHVM